MPWLGSHASFNGQNFFYAKKNSTVNAVVAVPFLYTGGLYSGLYTKATADFEPKTYNLKPK